MAFRSKRWLPADLETAVKRGGALVGSPGTLRDRVRDMADRNFIAQFSFGDLTQQEVLHSAGIFARDAIPAAQERAAQAIGYPPSTVDRKISAR